MTESTQMRPPARAVSALPGCYVFLIGGGLLLATIVWGGYTFFRQAGELAAFTDPEPAPLEVATPDPAEVDDISRRLSAFADAVSAGKPAEMTLTRDDVNTLLAGFPRLADLRSLIRVRDLGPEATFTADIRFPMNALPGHQRFLNGEMDGRFGVHPEVGLFVSVLDVRVPGRTVPPGFIEVYQRGIIPGKNFGFLDDMLVRNFRGDPIFARPLKSIASVRSDDDHLVVSTTKPQTKPDPTDASSASPAALGSETNATQSAEKN